MLGSCGESVCIDLGVQFVAPDRIEIGNGVELLRGCTLDGRSGYRNAISIGAGTRVKENVWLACYGGRIKLDERCLIGRNSVVHGHGGVEVGKRSGWGPGAVVLSYQPAYWADGGYEEQGYVPEPVRIGNDVHIGANAVILGGVSIDDRVVVGAGSVVATDLASGWVYAGSPARAISPLGEGGRPDLVSRHLPGLGLGDR